MRGIKIKNGALFVECGLSTYRYSERANWEVSSISYPALEWDLRTERPDSYELLSDGDIRTLGAEIFEGLVAIHKKSCARLGLDAEEALTLEMKGSDTNEDYDVQYAALLELLEAED